MLKVIKRILICIMTLVFLLLVACSDKVNEDGGGNRESEENKETGSSIELKFGSMFAPDHVQNEEVFASFNQDVRDLTNGRVSFQMHTGGALGGPQETLDNIVTGIMDVGGGLQGYNAGKYRIHTVLHLPFLADGDGADLSKVAQKLYDTFPEIQEEYSDVKPLWIHAADPYAIIT